MINDGSPDSGAISAFNTLTGKALPPGSSPVFWENIGTKITFSVANGTAPGLVLQPYPTYYEYRNGIRVSTRPQAASPSGKLRAESISVRDGFVSSPGWHYAWRTVWGRLVGGGFKREGAAVHNTMKNERTRFSVWLRLCAWRSAVLMRRNPDNPSRYR